MEMELISVFPSSPAAAYLNYIYKGEEHCRELVMENGTEVGDVSADGRLK